MNQSQIDRFFRILARELNAPATVMVTGAAAAALWGHARPSVDIDFAITFAPAGRRRWDALEVAVQRTTQVTGIGANYAEDIDRWGAITLLDYTRHTHRYRRFGTLDVRLLDPAYWSIGKVSRYLAPDVQDMEAVLRGERVPAARAIRLWARALRASPRSTACAQFRRQVEHFLRGSGRKVWGRSFDTEAAIRLFHHQLATPPSPKSPPLS